MDSLKAPARPQVESRSGGISAGSLSERLALRCFDWQSLARDLWSITLHTASRALQLLPAR